MSTTASTTLAGAGLCFSGTGMTYPDGTVALADVDLDVGPGDFVSVVGPSGCGKSTLLRLASGLEESTAGDLAVDRSRLAYTFQDATLLPWRSVWRNVQLLGELHGFPSKELDRRTADAIELVGLQGFEDHLPRQLSGGMKMRVSLARSLTLEPQIFLFDEPFGALDEISRERLNSELLAIFEAQRFAALFITHSISEAVYLSTEVAVMSGRPGRIVGRQPIPFPYPRDPDIRYSSEFSEICAGLSELLRGATE